MKLNSIKFLKNTKSKFFSYKKNFSSIEQIFDNNKLQEYNEKGYTVLPKVFSSDYIEELRSEITKIVKSVDVNELKSVFDTSHANSDEYFLGSGDKTRFFLEKNAFNKNGDLVNPLKDSINKIGHGK